MKKIITLLFCGIFFTQNIFSQWTISGTNIFNNNAGNVGIKNTSPGTICDIGNVTKSTFAAANTDILGLQVRSTSNQTATFKLGSFFITLKQ